MTRTPTEEKLKYTTSNSRLTGDERDILVVIPKMIVMRLGKFLRDYYHPKIEGEGGHNWG